MNNKIVIAAVVAVLAVIAALWLAQKPAENLSGLQAPAGQAGSGQVSGQAGTGQPTVTDFSLHASAGQAGVETDPELASIDRELRELDSMMAELQSLDASLAAEEANLNV